MTDTQSIVISLLAIVISLSNVALAVILGSARHRRNTRTPRE